MERYAFKSTSRPLYDVDIASIAALDEHIDPSNVIDILGPGYAHITLKATGEAVGASGVVTFHFVTRASNDDLWPNVPMFTADLTLEDEDEIIVGYDILVRGASQIRVLSVENADAAFAAEGVNAYVSFKT